MPISSSIKSVTWKISQDSILVDLPTAIDGELKADVGTIKVKSVGSYTFTATAVNNQGKEVKHEQSMIFIQ